MLFLLYVGVFWSWIQYSVFPLFSYWDELYSLIFGIFVLKAISEGGCKVNRNDAIIVTSLFVYCVAAILGNLIYNYASISAIINDLYLNLKFFMSLYATMIVFRNFDLQRYRENVIKHVEIITCIFLLLFIVDKLFKVFPVYEIRFGIASEQLIFAHPTFCAASIFFLLTIYMLFGDIKKTRTVLNICVLAGLICMTLRFKAIASVGIFLLLYVLFIWFRVQKLNVAIIGLAALGVVLVCYNQIYFYFFSDMALRMPRGAILNTSILIAKDYFPFGTGFGTFGSYISGVNYSVVYELYGIDQIGGMTKTDISAISDNYWPMVLGQSGVIGFLAMVNIWRVLYKKIDKYRYIDVKNYLAGMGGFVFILISSTSESAIVNPVSIPIAFVLGMMYSQEDIRLLSNRI